MKYFFALITILFCVKFSQAQENGPYKDYYDSGELKIEGQYQFKKRVGEWKNYYKNGQVSSIYNYKNGKRNKESRSFYKDGTLSRKTEKVGEHYIVTGYYESGKLKYERQDQTGYYKSYFESGEIEIATNYIDSELSGEWKRFHKKGQIEWIVNYKDGYRNGVYKQFYKNGDIKLEGENKKDIKNGEEKHYLPNNVLEWKGNYSNGKLDKTWIRYDVNGKKLEKFKFKNGLSLKSIVDIGLVEVKVPEGVLERVPVYPGCEEELTNKRRKRCMSQNVNNLIMSNFNKKLAANIGLSPGKKRIFVMFKIDKKGNVKAIKTRGPHPILEVEAKRVIKMLPKLQPGYQRGKPVIVPYSLPIVFQIQ